jgi:glycosyltransferase involved in cell wall biosynthesis
VALAALGHDVRVQLCSHRHLPSLESKTDGVHWSSHDVRTLGFRGLLRQLAQETQTFRPDWVIALSDTHYGWLARRLARISNARLAIDAYDNYEAYMPWNVPLHVLWRNSICAADLVTAAGPQLAQRLQSHRRGGHPVEIIPMAADPEFSPLDQLVCRHALGLPTDTHLVGYVGSWTKNRGTLMLIDAFRRARAAQPDLQLVLSGRPPAEVLAEPGVLGTGYVPDAQLPALINALDLACVITADTSFGRYSYPAKLCEAMACGVPVVATATEPVRWMLGKRTECLVPMGDAKALAARILGSLALPRADYGPRPTWAAHAERLNSLLTSVQV